MRPLSNVVLEAVIIGIMNLVLIRTIGSFKTGLPHGLEYIIAGASIHLLFEYTGANKWWCESTY